MFKTMKFGLLDVKIESQTIQQLIQRWEDLATMKYDPWDEHSAERKWVYWCCAQELRRLAIPVLESEEHWEENNRIEDAFYNKYRYRILDKADS